MDLSFNLPWFDLFLVGVVLTVVALIVFIGQGLFIAGNIDGEYSRKLIHILLSLWVACWRYLLPVNIIIIASLILAAVVFTTKKLGFLKSIHGVRRSTHGEITYALGITLTAILFPEPGVFALAILNLGFADGLAAIVGTRFGGRKYTWSGPSGKSGKTLIGSLAGFGFVVFSGAGFWLLAPVGAVWTLAVVHILLVAFLVTALEFISRHGFDNIVIPVATGFLYSQVMI